MQRINLSDEIEPGRTWGDALAELCQSAPDEESFRRQWDVMNELCERDHPGKHPQAAPQPYPSSSFAHSTNASDETVQAEEEPKSGEVPDYQAAQQKVEIEEARLRWNLDPGFTCDQVTAIYYERIDRVHSSEVDQLNRDYELLMEAAS